MAAALVARGPVRSRSTEILCVGSFSIVVDSVDGEVVTSDPQEEEVFGEDAPGGDIDARSDISNASSRGSRSSISKEETDAKLALFKVVLFLCMVGVALCAPQRPQAILLEEIPDVPEPYNFALAVNDDESTNYQTRQESQNEQGVVEGQYSWVGADGIRYITSYRATPDTGFEANTVKEQTDIVVKLPVPFVEEQQTQQRFI